jgi:DNA-binding beta-propeller fold protein YncE
LKKKTVYIWMSVIATLTVASFVAIYFFNLQSQVEKVTKPLDRNGPPVFSQLVYGDLENGLDKPMDVTKSGEFLYVTDTNNKRVQVFDVSGTAIHQFGKEGDDPGEFMFPYGITNDKKGNIYVADLYNGNISIFSNKGKFVDYFKETDDKNKVIKAPGGIRIFEEKLYVTDIEQSKVFVFDLTGKKLMELGKSGMNDGEFRAPNALTVDKEGNIYVVDTGNQRIQVFSGDGKFLRNINGSKDGKGSSVFVNPRGIGIDSRGIVYVVNNLTHFVYGFNEKGEKVFEFGGMGDSNEQFYLPNGLFVDDNDQVYITDTLNQRLAIYY